MSASDDEAPAGSAMEELLEVMRALRDPVTGCAWDREQTFASIVPYTIEEAYEVVDAIARDDMGDLRDELGDLLLQVVYHAQMASEAGSFDFEDVARAVTDKMVRRHPHVFGDATVASAEEQTRLWEAIKAGEAEEAKAGQGSESGSLLDAVPSGFPPLLQAVKLQKAAGRVGFDWREPAPIFAKIREELHELEDASAAGANLRIAEEMGDLLFVVANLARRLGVDPEAALIGANAKFRRRFARIEALLAERGKRPEESTLEEMDGLWDAAKREETGEK